MFGLYKSPDKVRFYIVEDRKAATLLPIIEERVNTGSSVVSDECALIAGWRSMDLFAKL